MIFQDDLAITNTFIFFNAGCNNHFIYKLLVQLSVNTNMKLYTITCFICISDLDVRKVFVFTIKFIRCTEKLI